jgi:hypothetical protein
MKENKTLWSIDLCIDLKNIKASFFEDKAIKNLAQKLNEKLDPGTEVMGVVTEFGKHNEDMKGFRVIHEGQNILITGHFIQKTKNVYLNIHSCIGFKTNEFLEFLVNEVDPEHFTWKRIYRQ